MLLAPRDPREVLTISVKLRGGPEGWVEVRARGVVRRYPGCTALYDVLMLLNGHRLG
jgi:hypothetical protein